MTGKGRQGRDRQHDLRGERMTGAVQAGTSGVPLTSPSGQARASCSRGNRIGAARDR